MPYYLYPPSGGDDSAMVQAAIDAVSDRGGDTIIPANGEYRCNVVLKSGAVIKGTSSPRRSFTDAPVRFRPFTEGGYAIDTPATQITDAGVIGVVVRGLGVGAVGGGIRFRDVHGGYLEKIGAEQFQDEAVKVEAGSLACTFRDIFAMNSLLNRDRASKIGVLDIDGTDHQIDGVIEATASLAALTAGGNVCAVVIRGDVMRVSGIVAEISDVGMYLAPGASRNQFSNVRADLNFGRGWDIAGSSNMFSSCLALNNSQEADNGFSGFYAAPTTGVGNVFAACASSSNLTNRQKFGFEDVVNSGTPGQRNQYTACNGTGNATGLFDDVAWLGSSPSLPSYPVRPVDADATPSVDNSELMVLQGYSTDTTITQFDAGVGAQRLTVIGDVNVTIANNATIKTVTGENLLLANNRAYMFQRYNGVWYQVG